jgi:hypothetical protein
MPQFLMARTCINWTVTDTSNSGAVRLSSFLVFGGGLIVLEALLA